MNLGFEYTNCNLSDRDWGDRLAVRLTRIRKESNSRRQKKMKFKIKEVQCYCMRMDELSFPALLQYTNLCILLSEAYGLMSGETLGGGFRHKGCDWRQRHFNYVK